MEKTVKEKIKLENLEKLANILSADSLEEALYYAGDDEELKKLLNDMMEEAMKDPEHIKRAKLLYELECLGKTEEELEELEKCSQIRKRGYSGESLEDLSKEYDIPIEKIKKLFEKKVSLTINYCTEKEYGDKS